MDIKVTGKALQAELKHHVEVTSVIQNAQVREITAKQYAKQSGINYDRVIIWCQDGILIARKITKNGKEITDWKNCQEFGSWYIDITQPIKTVGEL